MGVNMEYIVNGKPYEVVVIKKRNKNTYIRVKEDLKIYVTTNYLVTKSYIKKLLDENISSLKKMIDQACKKNEKKELFFYLGKTYDIICVSTLNDIEIDDINNLIYVSDYKMLDKWFNKIIKSTFENHFLNIYDKFEEVKVIPKLRIRKMKTRWGVYNRSNHSVTLNSELIKYPKEALDYVIVHELSHVIHFDHSKNFWNLVFKYCSNYKEIRKKLKE